MGKLLLTYELTLRFYANTKWTFFKKPLVGPKGQVPAIYAKTKVLNEWNSIYIKFDIKACVLLMHFRGLILNLNLFFEILAYRLTGSGTYHIGQTGKLLFSAYGTSF